MAMSVPPVETRRKPRNSPRSLTTRDDFIHPIVADEGGRCLGTLVPILRLTGEGGHYVISAARSRPPVRDAGGDCVPQSPFTIRSCAPERAGGPLLRPTRVHIVLPTH